MKSGRPAECPFRKPASAGSLLKRENSRQLSKATARLRYPAKVTQSR